MASVAFQQLRGLVETQEALLEGLRRQIAVQEKNSVSKAEYEDIVKKLEKEEEDHSKTKTSLAVVSEQLEFALGEIDVLSKHLEMEKQAFDSALSRVNNKVLKQSVQKDKLISKCSEIETHIQKQEDILNYKENEIKELQHFIDKQKQTLKKQASEFKIEKQQENYIAEALGKKNKKDFK
ncbi:spermatogenesis-associated protein 24 [Sceloporus undulatus]|uniref:spermatogenesis-associated protein 24 n=1 Tax=Sceloporus undulatus TaxID=8520 RepID=UPI001C4AA5C6|nr:spermatogenesis-associated protein 24 [Sceloporus undulatus]